MKKQNVQSLKLNKSLVSSLEANALKGGLDWTYDRPTGQSQFETECPPPTQTGSWCLTGYGTNCQ
ncbi:hypothetical protein C8N46_101335 [Kordia periserrulae]|uniref:Uncharacterized protein n=1 Tax=Kordia periserrulae TaxID=701523 RepID=A0A2T6C5W5_9FLAO|nr:hypothetical protein [Kordia periserrulae]PTX63731.1 hypothetical protein C8N46_101335 [Kordia periserrulae]